MGNIRLLDLGFVPALRSQTLYHALGHALVFDDLDTVILVSPINPYVCIGFHQDLEREVDLGCCQAEGLPVYRREVGGGAVYLDRNQFFVQWVFHRDHLPSSVENRFQLYALPLVETYRRLGIEAHYRPLNDIHVGGRKIGGMGAASMGEAEVVVGSLMFDFDSSRMARVLRVPSEKMRDKVYQSLREYMTTMARELGRTPDRDDVRTIYLEELRAALGSEIVPSTISEREEADLWEWDERFLTREWLYQRGGPLQPGVKIHSGVSVVEAAHKASGGLIRAVVRLQEGRIDDLTLSGDFTLLPTAALPAIERSLRGFAGRADALLRRVEDLYAAMDVRSPGVTPADFAAAVLAAMDQGEGRTLPTRD